MTDILSSQFFICMCHLQNGRFIKMSSDDHHAHRKVLNVACVDRQSWVTGDIERGSVVNHTQRCVQALWNIWLWNIITIRRHTKTCPHYHVRKGRKSGDRNPSVRVSYNRYGMGSIDPHIQYISMSYVEGSIMCLLPAHDMMNPNTSWTSRSNIIYCFCWEENSSIGLICNADDVQIEKGNFNIYKSQKYWCRS